MHERLDITGWCTSACSSCQCRRPKYTSSLTFANCRGFYRNSIYLFLHNTSLSPFIKSFPSSAFTKHGFHPAFVILWESAAIDRSSTTFFGSTPFYRELKLAYQLYRNLKTKRELSEICEIQHTAWNFLVLTAHATFTTSSIMHVKLLLNRTKW